WRPHATLVTARGATTRVVLESVWAARCSADQRVLHSVVIGKRVDGDAKYRTTVAEHRAGSALVKTLGNRQQRDGRQGHVADFKREAGAVRGNVVVRQPTDLWALQGRPVRIDEHRSGQRRIAIRRHCLDARRHAASAAVDGDQLERVLVLLVI